MGYDLVQQRRLLVRNFILCFAAAIVALPAAWGLNGSLEPWHVVLVAALCVIVLVGGWLWWRDEVDGAARVFSAGFVGLLLFAVPLFGGIHSLTPAYLVLGILVSYMLLGTWAGVAAAVAAITSLWVEVAFGPFPMLVAPSGDSLEVATDWSLFLATATGLFGMASRQMRGQIQALRERALAQRQLAEARQHALAEAESISQAKSAFLATMSHELRTPLNAILGYSELLFEELEGAQHREDLGKILWAGSHLLSLVDDVLDMARIESGRIDLETEDLDARQVIDAALRDVAPLLERSAQRVVVQGPPTTIRADRRRTHQILLNLLGNAAKYAGAGTVHVVIQAREGAARITVRDEGPGLPEELHEQVFAPFTRGHGQVPGTGLGLALSRTMARRMGGDLVLEEVPRGASFALELPAPPRRGLPGEAVGGPRTQESPLGLAEGGA